MAQPLRLTIRATPVLPVLDDERLQPLLEHAEGVRDWTRDAERSFRSLELAANSARDSDIRSTVSVGAGVPVVHPVDVADGTTLVRSNTATVNLPSAAAVPGRSYTVKLLVVPASGTSVAVTPVFGQTVDGAASTALSARYKYVTVQSDGSNWHIVANN